MWRFSKWALKSRPLTIIATIVISGVSIWALMGLKMELIPDIEFPYATIVTIYPDASPQMVAEKVTSPIENIAWQRWSGKSLKHLTSVSSEGISVIMAEFEFGTDMNGVISTLKQELDGLSLPPEVVNLPQITGTIDSNPQVIPINLSMLPLKMISVSGNLPAEELRRIVDTTLVPALADVDGVLSVQAEGGASDQIVVIPDTSRMVEHGISMSQILALLPQEAGSLEAIASTPLNEQGVLISDVAAINKSPSPLSVITRFNGKASIGLSVLKEDNANTVDVSDNIGVALDNVIPSLPEGIEVTGVFDQSDFIKDSVSELWNKAIVGGILAVVVVFIFLRAVRASLLTAISVPLSVLIGFLCMYFSGITINVLTLSAMSIAIGRLIDDSIVLVEVIYRRRQMGDGFKEAAIAGAKEVATPVTAATLATVAIFVPLMFIGGIVGELFVPFGLTITFALMGSLVVALMVVPALSRFLLAPRKSRSHKQGTTNWYQNVYLKGLKWTLRHRVPVLIVTAIVFVGSLALLPVVGTSFMPDMGEKMITIDIQLPPGSPLTSTSQAAAEVEEILSNMDAVDGYYTTIGTSSSLTGLMSAASGGGSNTASITAYLNQDADLDHESARIKQDTEGILEYGNIIVSGQEASMGSMGGSSVNLSVQGADQDEVRKVAIQLVEKLKEIEGLDEVEADITKVITRLKIEVDRQKLIESGLSQEQLELMQQEFMLLQMGGTIPGKTITLQGDSYQVYIGSVAAGLIDIDQARSLKIGFPLSVTLEQIARAEYVEMPSHIIHTDLSPSATITGNITVSNAGAVNTAIQRAIDNLPEHPGVEVKTAGIAEMMQDSFNSMGIALIGAVFLALLVMVVMMRSIRNPLIIMVSLPLASIGAMLGLLLTGHTLSLFGMLGVIMLVGIVLTNAVVLISMTEALRKEGLSVHDAILESGQARLRPILMTALTTIFAMLPLAIGLDSGIMMTAELAVVVIGGLFSSTLLTLFVIPAIYSLVSSKQSPK